MRNKGLILAGAALIVALPAIAQQAASPPAPAPTPAQPIAQPQPSTVTKQVSPADGAADDSAVEEVSSTGANPDDLTAAASQPPAPPVEYPSWARRDPWSVGPLSPAGAHIADDAWG